MKRADPGAVRPYRETDFPVLFEIDRRCFPPGVAYSRERLARRLSRSRGCAAVFEKESGIAGFAIGSMRGPAGGHLDTIDVLPEFRRAGVGRGLLAWIEETLAACGAQRVILEVAAENDPARRFYGRAGYEASGDLPDFYGAGVNGIRMRKDLKG